MRPETKLKLGNQYIKTIEDMESLDINDKNKYFCDDKYFQNPELIITDFGNYCPDEEQFNESLNNLLSSTRDIIKG